MFMMWVKRVNPGTNPVPTLPYGRQAVDAFQNNMQNGLIKHKLTQ